MATFTATITYPDNKQVDLRDTLAVAYAYPTTVQDGVDQDGNPIFIPNPESKAQFVQRKINEYLRDLVKNSYKEQKLRDAQLTISVLDVTI